MFKKLAFSASVLMLTGGLSLAETTMTRDPSTGRSVVTPQSSLSTTSWLASDIYKADVYDNAEHKIGDITDLVINKDGDVTGAVIGVGGFLGVGQKDVLVPFKQLKVSSRDNKDWLVLNQTKDDLMRAPAYDRKTANRM